MGTDPISDSEGGRRPGVRPQAHALSHCVSQNAFMTIPLDFLVAITPLVVLFVLWVLED